MNCPACGNPLHRMTVEDINVEACKGGCGGIWFDNFEVKKFDEPHESVGATLLRLETNPDVRVDHDQRRNCPHCKEIVMMRHFFSVKKQVEVDECPGCGGYWLDEGELHHIRSQFQTEEERDKAAAEFFSELFDDDLARMKQESRENAQKVRTVANLFKFICPSYYIPGRQKWGAF